MAYLIKARERGESYQAWAERTLGKDFPQIQKVASMLMEAYADGCRITRETYNDIIKNGKEILSK